MLWSRGRGHVAARMRTGVDALAPAGRVRTPGEARVREARAKLLPPAPEGPPVVVVQSRLPEPGETRLDGAGGEVVGLQLCDHPAHLFPFRGKVGDALDVRTLGRKPELPYAPMGARTKLSARGALAHCHIRIHLCNIIHNVINNNINTNIIINNNVIIINNNNNTKKKK
jgi:hypothetical protein